MAIPEVDKKMLRDLESMGFTNARSIRGLHFSEVDFFDACQVVIPLNENFIVMVGLPNRIEKEKSMCKIFASVPTLIFSLHQGNSSIEAAINWIIEHENDPDIDQVPLVPFTIEIENGTSWLTPDEVMAKQQNLREAARKRREEEEKRSEREREKDRRQSGKELLEAKRSDEENEKRRMLMLRKIEKDEEKRARDRVRQQLENDKAERRRKLRLQPQNPGDTRRGFSLQESKTSVSVKPTVKAGHMRECLRSLKKNNKEDDAKVKRAFQTLAVYVRNVARNPDEEKFRKIRLGNPNFQERVGRVKGGIEFLELCGFEKLKGEEEYLYLPKDKVDVVAMNTALSEIYSALGNPFFGVL